MNTDTFIESFGHIADAPGGIGKLRALILDLAVRGQLANQDPSDEPASMLLERIRAERDRMVQAKEIRNPKPLPPIDPDVVPYELPAGWEWARLGDVFISSSPKKVLSKADYTGGGVLPVIGQGVESVMGWSDEHELLVSVPDGEAVLLFGNHTRAVKFVDRDFIQGPNSTLLRPVLTLARYLYYGMRTLRYRDRGYATYFKEVPARPIPLPPVPEQQRIVAKVDQLMQLCDDLEAAQGQRERTRVDLGVSTLRHLAESAEGDLGGFWKMFADNIGHHLAPGAGDQAVLKELRRTILDLAVRGRLTKQDPSDEPASALLERIRVERDRMVRAKEIRKPKPLPPIDPEEVPYELPAGWEWVRLGDIADGINGDRSKNYPSKEHRVPSGVPFVNAGHLIDGRVSFREMDFISHERFALLKGGKIRGKDILYCLRGSLGKAALVEDLETGTIASSLLILRAVDRDLAPYLYMVLTSPFGQAQIRSYDNGSAQPNLSAANVVKFAVPVPPLAEQQRIMAKIDHLMQLCDELGQQFSAAEAGRSDLAASVVRHAVEARTLAAAG